MATITKIASTPNMLRYQIDVAAEGGEVATITQTALIAAAHDGPLKSLLTSPLFQPSPGQGPNPNNWSNLHTDARLTVSLVPYGTSPVPSSFQFNTASGNALQVEVNDTASVLLELRYENTPVR